jgi:2-oxoglutarate dehydrogenase E1 component
MVISSLQDLAQSFFQEILFDSSSLSSAKKVLFCSGKIYYDLLQKSQKNANQEISIVRIEQLCPFPQKQCTTILENTSAAKYFWVQEEPRNMGAWKWIQECFQNFFQKEIFYIGRKASASPASGISKIHYQEQESIINEALS